MRFIYKTVAGLLHWRFRSSPKMRFLSNDGKDPFRHHDWIELWQRKFGGDRSIVGQNVTLSRLGFAPYGCWSYAGRRPLSAFAPGVAQEPNYNVNATVDYWMPAASPAGVCSSCFSQAPLWSAPNSRFHRRLTENRWCAGGRMTLPHQISKLKKQLRGHLNNPRIVGRRDRPERRLPVGHPEGFWKFTWLNALKSSARSSTRTAS